MFLRLLSYALLAVFPTAWSLSQTGKQAGVLSHVTETSRTRTRPHGYDNYVKRYRFLSRQKLLRKLWYVICCNKFTTLALLTKRRRVRQTRFTPRCFMSHRLCARVPQKQHICSLRVAIDYVTHFEQINVAVVIHTRCPSRIWATHMRKRDLRFLWILRTAEW